jgi:hypothetical protein
MRGKTNFASRFKPIARSSPPAKNISLSFFPKLMFPTDVPCLRRGALRGRHERWARDAVDVSELQRAIRAPTNNSDADGKAVWSWHPDADAKLAGRFRVAQVTGAKEPGPRGELGAAVKTIAWGMPDDSGASAVNTRVHTQLPQRTRGCGCIGHPAFPAPSISKGERTCKARAPTAPRQGDCMSAVFRDDRYPH